MVNSDHKFPLSSGGGASSGESGKTLLCSDGASLSDCDDAPDVCRYRDELEVLRQQVVKDPLTGLFNIRYFQMALEREIERTERSGGALSLAMIDLDHFKKVNDTWGHEVGNQVLQTVAGTLVKMTRKIDVQCRYGGEEFAVLLPTASASVAAMVGERLRQAISRCVIPHESGDIRVTASIGIATVTNLDDIAPERLTDMADQQLYEAKLSGRNCVRGIGANVIDV